MNNLKPHLQTLISINNACSFISHMEASDFYQPAEWMRSGNPAATCMPGHWQTCEASGSSEAGTQSGEEHFNEMEMEKKQTQFQKIVCCTQVH